MKSLRQLFNGSLPSAIFFDLDGTLIDSVPDLAFAVDAMLEDFSLAPAGVENVRQWVGNGAPLLVERALLNSTAKDKASELKAKALQAFLYHYGHLPKKQSALYPGVLSTLEALKAQDIKMALITNKPTEFLPALLEEFALAPYFDFVAGGDSFSEKKPSPMPLKKALAFFQLTPGQCLMVGDSKNDINAANACNMASVCVTYGYNYLQDARELPASLHINHFAELVS